MKRLNVFDASLTHWQAMAAEVNTAMIALYGISNCDTIRKAKKWLEQENIDYRFHDYRKQGLEAQQLQGWVEQLGWEAILNRRGTTWRKLSDEQKQDISQQRAIELMLEYPAIIKRPLLAAGDDLELGFSEQKYRARFGQS
ncbi:MAG: ArsC family reductase [Motiliproteus sp.]